MVIIATHALFSDKGEYIEGGTGREIQAFLEKINTDYVIIQHSICGGFSSRIQYYKKGVIVIKKIGLSWLPFPLQILQEYIIDFYIVILLREKIQLFIGINPLNGVMGDALKQLGLTKKSIFYTADYAYRRFNNSILNSFYHFFDKVAVLGADEVWNVSSRIVKEREKQGVNKKKNFLVPNSPSFNTVKRELNKNINKFDLVFVGHITRAINYKLLLQVVKILIRKYKKIRLIIIGTGPYENEIKLLVEKLSITDRVIFLGLKDHDKVIKILKKSGIGVALYTNEFPWTQFGDSMKVREYLACGLPVIMTGIPSTADDVRNSNAGFIIKETEKEFIDSLDKIFSNDVLYQSMRKNALALGQKFDITKILTERLKFLRE